MPTANTKLSDKAWLERRYRYDAATVATIAAEAGVNVSTVHRALARHGITLRGPLGRRTLVDVSNRTVRATVRKAETLTDAARALGVDLETLRARLARMGDRPWPGGKEGAEEMSADYAAGLSLVAIAEAQGVSTRTVRRRLAAAGVDMRSRGRPSR